MLSFYAVCFLCNQCFAFLTQNCQHLFCKDSMPSNFHFWFKKKKDITTKTMHSFSPEDNFFFQVNTAYVFSLFFSCSVNKLRNPSTVCTVLASCSLVTLGTCLFPLSVLIQRRRFSSAKICTDYNFCDLIVFKLSWHFCTSIIEGSVCPADPYYHNMREGKNIVCLRMQSAQAQIAITKINLFVCKLKK